MYPSIAIFKNNSHHSLKDDFHAKDGISELIIGINEHCYKVISTDYGSYKSAIPFSSVLSECVDVGRIGPKSYSCSIL